MQTTPPDCLLSPSAVRGSQLGSRHHPLQHIPGHRPAVTSPVMVPRLNQSLLIRSSPVSPTEGRSSGSGPSQEVLGSPQSRFVPISHLAVVREHLQTAGFLVSTAD